MNNFIVGFRQGITSTATSDYIVCGQWKGEAPNGATMVVTCVPWLPSVRYVMITTLNDKSMNFCEVEVYGKSS